MHSNEIVHRDLKPENVMLVNNIDDINKSGKKIHVKIIDFGMAAKFHTNKMLTKMLGTSYYVAPEVLLQNYSYKCDIWSCGVIL